MWGLCVIIMDYIKLVDTVRKYYLNSDVVGGTYSKKNSQTGKRDKKSFYLKWCPECEEINLWTYWQGHKNKKAKILLFGQDWSCPWDSQNGLLLEYVKNILQDDVHCSERYIQEINNGSLSTDNMLGKLMQSLGDEYDPFTPDNENLFFSNLCLGYRDYGASGGLNKTVLLHDVEYAKELIHIVEPKIVICLGKDTYDSFVYGANCTPKSKEKSFYKKLAQGECYSIFEDRIPVFGQAHTGSLGAINRWRYNPEKYEYSEEIVNQILFDDWTKMKKFLD